MADQQQFPVPIHDDGGVSGAPNLRPDYIDSSSDPTILPSFKDIRSKTLRALYGLSDGNHSLQLFIDKSPKGSVDEAIRPLVDLINSHPAYATLSSCSGRIALFDPSASCTFQDNNNVDLLGQEREDNIINADEEVGGAKNSGKGSGRWALSSHATITSDRLINILDSDSEMSNQSDDCPLMFKHEPLLLHVAASCPRRAEKLLSLALSLGFRESGIVSTPKRVTVAIRGVGLSLTVPLARSGVLRPSNDYLKALVKEANDRFVLNEAKLDALYKKVESELFVIATDDQGDVNELHDAEQSAQNEKICEAIFRPLPPLNLWGHAAVAVPIIAEPSALVVDDKNISDGRSSHDIDVYVFGGYGMGPAEESCARSDKFYCLSRRRGIWASAWRRLNMLDTDPSALGSTYDFIHGIHVQRATFSAREGLAACMLPLVASDPDRSPVVALFGGRAGPSHPSDELFLFAPQKSPECLWSPTDIRGEPPSARWGHTFTALSGRKGLLAVLCGGRTRHGMVSTAHILTSCQAGGNSDAVSHFKWEKVSFDIPVFQHTALGVACEESLGPEKVFVFGGASDSSNILDSFSSVVDSSLDGPTGGKSRNKSSVLVLNIDPNGIQHSSERVDESSFSSRALIGASACSISLTESKKKIAPMMAVSGGISDGNESALRLFGFERKGDRRHLIAYHTRCRLAQDASLSKPASTGRVKVGPMTRHCCLSLPAGMDEPPGLLIVGGGISSFAFGPTFSGSWTVSLRRAKSRGDTSLREAFPNTAAERSSRDKNAKVRPKLGNSASTDVLYVKKTKAKGLKMALEQLKFLDKTKRMTWADSSCGLEEPSQYIAVPVTESCKDFLSKTAPDSNSSSCYWISLISGMGTQDVPLSTKMLGNRHARR